MQPPMGTGFEPTFEMELFKGNPVSGSLNAAWLQGLDLDQRSVNAPLVLNGHKFVQLTMDGVTYSRIDYQCSLTKYE